jgi:hypothetical protein
MSSYLRLAADTADWYLAALADSQEHFVNSVSALAGWAPKAAAVPAYSAVLWTPQELSKASFAFVEKLLQQQKDFVQKVVAVTRSDGLLKGPVGERAAVSAVRTKDIKSEPIALRAPTHDRPESSQRSSGKRTASETGQIAVAKRPGVLPTTAVPRKSRKSGR